MQIRENISLQPFNTFGIAATARFFALFQSKDDLEEIFAFNRNRQEEIFVLGGGSNILLTKDINGLVIKNEIKGIEIIKEDDSHIYIKAGAGVNWHQFVLYCVENGYAGAENLSLIPGNVGASPMQNIGAYGVEIKDIFHELEAYHKEEKSLQTFSLSDCEFGYRESVFKRKFKGQFIITSVTYRLNKKPVFHTSYGA
ncbi:MAG: FAD-binding protein, partial [Chitinophagaceae bacterium]